MNIEIEFNSTIRELAEKSQEMAAKDTSPLVCLVAGPGTGKSKVIEQRVLYLLKKEVNANNIFAVSYTRASANDLKDRVYNYCKEKKYNNVNGVGISTLHSLALKILKISGVFLNFPVDPKVLDDWEIENIFDREFSELSQYSKRHASKIRKYHESIWNIEDAGDYSTSHNNISITITEKEKRVFEQFYLYWIYLYAAILPGEIIRSCVKKIENNLSCIKSYLNISHLIIDEFQDLNPMDLKFIDLIIKSGINVFVAGDDDQSIYSFRHASPIGLQNFTQRPSAELHILKHCFRCPSVILNSAVALIERYGGQNRIKKQYISMYDSSSPKLNGIVKLWKFKGYKKEAEGIAKSCKKLKEAGLSYDSILVLVANTQMQLKAIKEAFNDYKIKYNSPKEKDFQDTKIGRGLLSLLRLVATNEARKTDKRQDDYIALRYIVKNKKGVGKETFNKIVKTIISNQLNFRNIFENSLSDNKFDRKEIKVIFAIRKYLKNIDSWRSADTIEEKRNDIKNFLSLTNFKPIEVQELNEFLDSLPQQANFQELKAYMEADTLNNKKIAVKHIYERLGIQDNIDTPQTEAVKIMTLHGCKGLSGDVVFIPGLEKGLLPNDKQVNNDKIKEGARMLFVGITRAKRCCVLSYSTKRWIYTELKTQEASEYISHLNNQFEDGDILSKIECEKIISII